jgi:hypothetical protein
MARTGRPRVPIDWDEFDACCGLQATLAEIADYFDCSEDTIENRVKEEKGVTFSEYFAKKRGRGLLSLRRKQFQAAMAGDKTMLVFLGKAWLGQTDRTDITTGGQPLPSAPAEVRVYRMPGNGRQPALEESAAARDLARTRNGNGNGKRA